MALIKEKEITLTSKVGGEEVTQSFAIGRYSADEGMRMFGIAVELFDRSARSKRTNEFKALGDFMKEICLDFCKYVEGISKEDGKRQPLTNRVSMNSYVSDYEMMLQLIRAVHDHNSFFFNSEKLLKTSLSFKDRVFQALTKTLTDLSGSLSAKAKPRSKSSAKSTT